MPFVVADRFCSKGLKYRSSRKASAFAALLAPITHANRRGVTPNFTIIFLSFYFTREGRADAGAMRRVRDPHRAEMRKCQARSHRKFMLCMSFATMVELPTTMIVPCVRSHN